MYATPYNSCFYKVLCTKRVHKRLNMCEV